MRTLNIPISEEIFFVLKKDENSLQKEAKIILAMQYFKDRKLGLGHAAKMAEMSKDEFTLLLGKNQIDIYQYTGEELEDEFKLVDMISEG